MTQKLTILIIISAILLNDVACQVCEISCQRGIDQSYNYATEIHTKLTEATATLQTRILKLENKEIGVLAELHNIATRVAFVENYLLGNVSHLHNRISDEVNSLWSDTSEAINSLRVDVAVAVKNLTSMISSHHNGEQFPGSDICSKMSKRLDTLENGKLRNLTADNIIWRRNFRVLNASLQKIRSQNCICRRRR